RFNALHPGIISDTPAWSDKKEAITNIEKRTPGGRLATTEDVVGAVDFLLTNKGVNGINLVIDRGWPRTSFRRRVSTERQSPAGIDPGAEPAGAPWSNGCFRGRPLTCLSGSG